MIFINIQDSAVQIEDNTTETKTPNTLLSTDPNEAGENFGHPFLWSHMTSQLKL
ncbi:MAG: hypothetical protein KTR26_14230 [Flammeovirgaceae bacterium]|nr:hypothetical protein [Flammeovirgaceae bacterium]